MTDNVGVMVVYSPGVPIQSPFAMVSDEIIAHILTILMSIDQLALVLSAPNVCRRWRSVCRDLVSLEIHAGGSTTETRTVTKFLPRIFKTFWWIKKLDLSQIDSIYAYWFSPTMRGMHNSTPPVDWRGLVNGPYLKQLSLENSVSTSDTEIRVLATKCPGLELLNLKNSRITNASSIVLSAKCIGLKHLNLECCALTDYAIIALATGCGGLEHLNLGYCNRITDAAIITLAAGCKGLKHLDLTRCRITNNSIDALASSCIGLKHLTLSKCINITDSAIIALAASCKGLRFLDVSWCIKLTIYAMSSMADKYEGLVCLHKGCVRIRVYFM